MAQGDLIRFIIGITIGAIIFFTIYSIWINPSFLQNFDKDSNNTIYRRLENSRELKDNLIAKCKEDFNNCGEVVSLKYGSSFKILKIEEFEDKTKAEDFFYTWGSYGSFANNFNYILSANYPLGDPYSISSIDAVAPIVLIAVRVTGADGQQTPTIAFCDKEGKLTKYTKQILICG